MTKYQRNRVRRLVAVLAWSMIASAMAWGNLSPSDGGHLGAGWLTADVDWYLNHYGWPAQYRLRRTTVTTTGMISFQGKRIGPQSTSVRDMWRVSGLLVDSAAALLMLTSTALVLKKWLGGVRLTQLSLKTVMIMISVIAILMTMYMARNDLNAMMPEWSHVRHLWAIPMYLKVPFSIGLGCVAFVVISSGVSAIGRLLHIWQQRRWCDNSVADSSIAGPDAENTLDSHTVQSASHPACGNLHTSVRSRLDSSEPPYLFDVLGRFDGCREPRPERAAGCWCATLG